MAVGATEFVVVFGSKSGAALTEGADALVTVGAVLCISGPWHPQFLV